MTRSPTKAALASLTTAALLTWSGAAAAQAPAPAAQTPALAGPVVPGVCLLSQDQLIGGSKVGQAASARLHVLTQQVQTALDAEKAKLDKRAAALNAQRATLAPAQFQAQGQALNQRAQSLQAEAGERSRQIDATRAKVLSQIVQQARPYIAVAYGAHACGLLVSREAVLGGNMANDLTPEVIAALDAKATPLTFDLEPAVAAPAK
jgi:Skp family chaperone for outer membrane proteins